MSKVYLSFARRCHSQIQGPRLWPSITYDLRPRSQAHLSCCSPGEGLALRALSISARLGTHTTPSPRPQHHCTADVRMAVLEVARLNRWTRRLTRNWGLHLGNGRPQRGSGGAPRDGPRGGCPKRVPVATEEVHTGPGVDRCGAAAPRPPLFIAWSNDSSGHHPCSSGPGDPAVKGAPPASASAVDVITLDDETTTYNVQPPPKRAKVIHYMHAMQTPVHSLGLIGMLRLSRTRKLLYGWSAQPAVLSPAMVKATQPATQPLKNH
eukprot:364150-Chlamydomonas_euryale.AAC.4